MSYLLGDFNETKDFVCQTKIETIFTPSCSCYDEKSKNDLGFLALSISFLKLMKSEIPIERICNANSSIFSEDCYYDSDNIEKTFNKTLIFEESKTMLLNFRERIYNFKNFRSSFYKINGDNEYFVVIKIIQGGKIFDLLLINWELQFSELNNSLLSFKDQEVFIVSDPYNGCTDATKKKYNLLFTYGKNDSFVIKSFDFYKKQIVNNQIYKEMLSYNECKNYIKVYDSCKTSLGSFDDYYAKQLLRASCYSYSWVKLTKPQKCALIDIFCEFGDQLIVKNQDFRRYIEDLTFDQPFIWKNSSRYTNDMNILSSNKIPLILSKDYPCVETLLDIKIQRNCTFSSLNFISQQIIEQIISNTSTISELNVTNFKNLIVSNGEKVFLETNTLNAFIEILTNNNQTSFELTRGLITLPEQYLLDQWESICPNIINISNINDTNNFMGGTVLEIDNAQEDVMKAMKDGGFVRDRDYYFFNELNASNIQVENIKAFQRLWNCNNDQNPMEENGIFSFEVEERLVKIEVKGFGKLCV